MLPVRCFSCNKVIGHMGDRYKRLLARVTPEEAFGELGVTRYCCKMVILTNVDMTEQKNDFHRTNQLTSACDTGRHVVSVRTAVPSRCAPPPVLPGKCSRARPGFPGDRAEGAAAGPGDASGDAGAFCPSSLLVPTLSTVPDAGEGEVVGARPGTGESACVAGPSAEHGAPGGAGYKQGCGADPKGSDAPAGAAPGQQPLTPEELQRVFMSSGASGSDGLLFMQGARQPTAGSAHVSANGARASPPPGRGEKRPHPVEDNDDAAPSRQRRFIRAL